MRALKVTGVLPPTRVNWPLSSVPNKARCACGGRSSSSLTNSVPAPARSRTPGATCPPDSVPNSTCSAPSPRSVLEISVTNGRAARGLAS